MVDSAHVRQTAEVCAAFLERQLAADWTRPIPDLDMSIVEVVAHMAEGCMWYAIDLAAGGKDLDPVEHRVKTESRNADVVDTLRTYAFVVAAVVETAPATARGFHPMGAADPSGFAAMACDELLVHTDDVGRALGVEFTPSPDLVAPVLGRLFPWVSEGADPWQQLRWANGRIAYDDQPRLSGWAWHCAPIAEWDGTVAVHPGADPSQQGTA